MHLYVFADAMVQFDGNVTCILHYGVGHVGKVHGLAVEMLSADAEEHFCMCEYLWKLPKSRAKGGKKKIVFCVCAQIRNNVRIEVGK